MLPLALCAIADDEHAEEVLAAGRRLAGTGAFRVVFVHVAEGTLPSVASGNARGAAAASSLAQAGVEGGAHDAGVQLLDRVGVAPDEETVVVVGEPVEELARLAAEDDALLVIVGSHRRGPITGALLGSVSRRLAREGSRPVLIARPAALPGDGGPIVCGVEDDGACSMRAAVTAAALARELYRPLVLAHVLPDLPRAVPVATVPVAAQVPLSVSDDKTGRQLLEHVAGELDAPDIELVLLRGEAAGRLERLARGRHADMLVIGCHGRGLIRAVSDRAVSLELARSAERPVVVVPPEDP